MTILLIYIAIDELMAGESGFFFKFIYIPYFNGFIMGTCSKIICFRVSCEGFDGVGVCFFDESGWSYLVDGEFLLFLDDMFAFHNIFIKQ